MNEAEQIERAIADIAEEARQRDIEEGWLDEHGQPISGGSERARIDSQTPDMFKAGGSFILDTPATPRAIWGSDEHVIWPDGEALMIAAPQGVGKTTVALQVVRARLGLQDQVLGYPVQQTGGRILYLAMDRPKQMSRAAARIFTERDRELLDAQLVVWQGPPPYDMAVRRDILTAMCDRAKADTVIIDSIKDAAIGISKDEVGAGYNRARQQALAEGIQVLELHHMRKASGDNKQPDTLDDIYGSTWLTSGAGSVVLLWGQAGDPIVSWRHLKTPAQEVGPFRVVHDQAAGTSDVEHDIDPLLMVRRAGHSGLSAQEFAVALFETVKPTRAQVEKARRRLDKKVDENLLWRVGGDRGGPPARWHLMASE